MNTRIAGVFGVMLVCTACSGNEQSIYIPPTVPVADPPGDDHDDQGDPPNFTTCNGGWFASYYNLPPTHPDIEPEEGYLAGTDPTVFDWWDQDFISFEKYDPSLEFGPNWYPVDEGIEGDPNYYSVKWNAWMRATDDSDVRMVFAGTSDAWLMIGEDREVVASIESEENFTVLEVDEYIRSGVYPIEIRYTHRMGNAGFRFRVVSGDVIICFPDYSDD